jgi:thiamine biosynthesis lipoprotein
MSKKPDAFALEPHGTKDGPVHRFSHNAMASFFGVIIAGQDARYARQAAEAAFDECDRLEHELSRFIPGSDVWQINGLAAGQYVRVGVATMECLTAAAKVNAETGGVFDVTVGALIACFRGQDGSMRRPSADEVAAARKRTGMHLLDLRPSEFLVGSRADGVRVDLGGIGKGYAVDQMTALLKEWGIRSALVHGGMSSVLATGAPPGRQGWLVSLRTPEGEDDLVGTMLLRDRSLSGSAQPAGHGHIIDPRTVTLAAGPLAVWATADTAMLTDCLSTAFYILKPAEVEEYCRRRPDVGGMVAVKDSSGRTVLRYGEWRGFAELKP